MWQKGSIRISMLLLCASLASLGKPATHAAGPTAAVRFVLAANTSSAVDISANGLLLLSGVHPQSATDYFELPAGVYHFHAQVTKNDTGNDTGVEGTLLNMDVAAQLQSDLNYTVVLDQDPRATMLLVDDNAWPDASEIRLRVVNLASSKTIAWSSQLTDTAPVTYPNTLSFRGVSHYLTFTQASLPRRIVGVPSETASVVLDPKRLIGGTVYTVFVFDASQKTLKASISIDSRAILLPETGEANVEGVTR